MIAGRIYIENRKSLNGNVMDFIEVNEGKKFIDDGIPSLVVSKELTKLFFPDYQLKFTDKTIRDNIMWTRSKMEKRNEFERDILVFQENIFNKLIKKLSYRYLDIFSGDLSAIKTAISEIKENRNLIYINGNMIYVYDGGESVWGFSLNDSNYIGISNKKIIKLLNRENNVIISNADILNSFTKKRIENREYLLPYLFFSREIV